MSDEETKHKLEIMLANYQANGQSDWSFVYELLQLIKQHREAYALEENKNGFFAACGVCGVEDLENVEQYYQMYRAELREKVGKL